MYESWRPSGSDLAGIRRAAPPRVLERLGFAAREDGGRVSAERDGTALEGRRNPDGTWAFSGGADIIDAVAGALGISRADSAARIMEALTDEANSLDPVPMWEHLGFPVERVTDREARVLDPAGGCLYRSTFRGGRWVSGGRDPGNPIAPKVGNNVSVLRHFSGMRWTDAVFAMLALPRGGTAPAAAPSPAGEGPRIPPQTAAARTICRRYLTEERRIADSVIDACEDAGILAYAGRDQARGRQAAVLFLGRMPDGRVALASRRVAGTPLPGDFSKSSDMAGSRKDRVPVFRGSDTVFVVEGGANMLTVLQMHERLDLPLPTVFMSDGQGNRKWIACPDNAEILRNAGHVWLVGENDSAEAERGGMKGRMLAALSEAAGGKASVFPIPRPCKDINDVLCANPELLDELGRDRLAASCAPRRAQRVAP